MTPTIGPPSLLDLAGGSEDDHEASPDELLLEVMDLVTLAFPEPLHEMVISFVESEDRKRPALSNLDGKALPGQPKRPDLGHGDNAVLDAINSLLVDLMTATMRQGGVAVLTGRLEMKDGPDGDRFVELKDSTQGDKVMMRRRYDKSELRWLFWTAPLFAALAATEERERTQRAAIDKALARYDAFRIDMVQGEITFSSARRPEEPPVVWGFELLGSWADETKRMLWGWANESAPERIKRGVDALRASSTAAGLRALTEASFGCPEPCAERLVRHAAATMGAVGVYRAPFKSSQTKGFMYLALSPRTEAAATG